MNEATKNSLISAITSILMLAGSLPTIAAIVPADDLKNLITQIPGAVSAVGVLLTLGGFVYKLIPKPASSIVKGAAELPQVSQIVTTPHIADKVNKPEVVS